MELSSDWVTSLLDLVMDDIQTRIVVVDDESVICFANRAATKWFGVTRVNAENRPLGDFLSTDVANDLLRLTREALTSGNELSTDILDRGEGLRCRARPIRSDSESHRAIALSFYPLYLVGSCSPRSASQSLHRAKIQERGVIGCLTPRELEVLEFIVRGMSTKEIAKQLQRSRRTIDCHRAAIQSKLNEPCLTGLVLLGLRAGIIRMTGTSDLHDRTVDECFFAMPTLSD